MSAHSAEGGRTDSTGARGMQQVGEHGSGIARDIIGLHEALPGEILEQGVLLRLHLHSLVRYAVTCRVAFRHAVASAAMEAGVVPPLPPAATVFNWLHFARCTRGIQRSALALGEGSTFVVDASGGGGVVVDYNLIRDNDAVDSHMHLGFLCGRPTLGLTAVPSLPKCLAVATGFFFSLLID